MNFRKYKHDAQASGWVGRMRTHLLALRACICDNLENIRFTYFTGIFFLGWQFVTMIPRQ
jgi:hypothetical protein